MNTPSAALPTTEVDATRFRFAVVVSKFNRAVTGKLEKGALECFARHGVPHEHISVFYCPGAFELPQVAERLLRTSKHDAVVCLGAVIRGETSHFEYVANACARGIQDVALKYSVPVAFGVLTTDSEAQAMERAGGKHGNKGWDAALAAIEMADLFRHIARQRAFASKRKKRR
ncbi:MAG TPA: 6,7-dimethyl-8-ribityllumazine synthase [Bacteroidota bacterium]|nr:6,7-dimethyl-8-ribityllumazine synthase [Bacteroidota bacterium]